MITKYKTKDLRINADFMKYRKGAVISVKVDDGIPIDSFWRRRLKDAEFDNCVEFVKRKKGGRK